MQSLRWYAKRLRMMSWREIVWRLESLVAERIEGLKVACHWTPKPQLRPEELPGQLPDVGFHVIRASQSEYLPLWRERLLSQANDLLAHRFSYFNLDKVYLGDPIDWHRDHNAGIASCQQAVRAVDYRRFEQNGDCKQVWEPNRHHQLVVLARAYYITREPRYAEEVITQLQSWLDANPFGFGMNWRSPLELAIRLINWVWALDLIADSGLFHGSIHERVVRAVYQQCRDIARKFSQGSSANNHLIGEAAGLYIASSYFHFFPESAAWRSQSKAILESQIMAQSYPDGGGREHAFSYQFFTWQFFLLSGLVASWRRDEFSPAYWQRLGSMAGFLAKLGQGGPVPMLGDQDDGYVLDLGDPVHDIEALKSIAARLFPEHSEFFPAGESESGSWLLSTPLKPVPADTRLSTECFPDSGYYLLQHGRAGDADSVSVVFDAAELGYTRIAAHGHADALSLVVRLAGKELLVDSGTYDYFSHPEWRNYFRSTRAHNTVEIDGLDQSVNCGPFMWQQHAECSQVTWQPDDDGGQVCASHNGYHRLFDPVTHTRCVALHADQRVLRITDTLECKEEHEIKQYFHFSEYCNEFDLQPGQLSLRCDGRLVRVSFSRLLVAHLVSGSGDPAEAVPGGGWLSRRYHCLTPTTSLVLYTRIGADESLVTEFYWEPD